MMSGFEVAIAHVAGPKINRMHDGSKWRVNGLRGREIGGEDSVRRSMVNVKQYGQPDTTWRKDKCLLHSTTLLWKTPNSDLDNTKKKQKSPHQQNTEHWTLNVSLCPFSIVDDEANEQCVNKLCSYEKKQDMLYWVVLLQYDLNSYKKQTKADGDCKRTNGLRRNWNTGRWSDGPKGHLGFTEIAA